MLASYPPFRHGHPCPLLVEPDQRRFVWSLRECLRDGSPLPSDDELVEAFGKPGESPWHAAAAAHVRVADVMREHGSLVPPTHAIKQVAEETSWAEGLIIDLACELQPGSGPFSPRGKWQLRGDWRVAVGAVSAGLLLVEETGPAPVGHVADLTVERVANGSGRIHCSPTQAFLWTDPSWRQAEANVRAALDKVFPSDVDLRWSLGFPEGTPRQLSGGSGGALLALAGARLLACDDAPWSDLDLDGVAVSAKLEAGGGLLPVALEEKLTACIHGTMFPVISVLLVAEGQFENLSHLASLDPRRTDPHRLVLRGRHRRGRGSGELIVLEAANLRQAAERLQLEREAACHDSETLARAPSDYVHREELHELIAQTIRRGHDAGRTSGSLLLVGGAGVGKTSWLTGHLHHQRQEGLAPVYYFLNYSGGDRNASVPIWRIAHSLYSQLKRKYRLRDVAGLNPQSQDTQSWVVWLREILAAVSSALCEEEAAPPQRWEVIHVEAADQLAETEHLLAGLFQPDLPPGIWLMITSRQNTRFLKNPRNLEVFDFITLQPLQDGGAPSATDAAESSQGYREAVRRFLESGSQQLAEPLGAELIESIVSNPGVCPIFKTVRDRLDQLNGSRENLDSVGDLRSDPTLWLLDANERALEEARQFERRVKEEFGPEQVPKGWMVLALVETLNSWGRGFSRSEMAHLLDSAFFAPLEDLADVIDGAVEERRLRSQEETRAQLAANLNRLLDHAANFFRYRSHQDSGVAPYYLDHPSYHRLVCRHLEELGVEKEFHAILAAACDRLWREEGGHPHLLDYAIDRRLFHHVRAGDVNRVATALGDWPFLANKISRRGWVAIHEDARLADSVKWRQAEGRAIKQWETFLRRRLGRYGAFREQNVLPEAICQLLSDDIHNELLNAPSVAARIH